MVLAGDALFFLVFARVSHELGGALFSAGFGLLFYLMGLLLLSYQDEIIYPGKGTMGVVMGAAIIAAATFGYLTSLAG